MTLCYIFVGVVLFYLYCKTVFWNSGGCLEVRRFYPFLRLLPHSSRVGGASLLAAAYFVEIEKLRFVGSFWLIRILSGLGCIMDGILDINKRKVIRFYTVSVFISQLKTTRGYFHLTRQALHSTVIERLVLLFDLSNAPNLYQIIVT